MSCSIGAAAQLPTTHSTLNRRPKSRNARLQQPALLMPNNASAEWTSQTASFGALCLQTLFGTASTDPSERMAASAAAHPADSGAA